MRFRSSGNMPERMSFIEEGSMLEEGPMLVGVSVMGPGIPAATRITVRGAITAQDTLTAGAGFHLSIKIRTIHMSTVGVQATI